MNYISKKSIKNVYVYVRDTQRDQSETWSGFRDIGWELVNGQGQICGCDKPQGSPSMRNTVRKPVTAFLAAKELTDSSVGNLHATDFSPTAS